MTKRPAVLSPRLASNRNETLLDPLRIREAGEITVT
jgi:hypothetical protein